MITRSIQVKIANNLYKQKVIIIYGARRVGKTTLAHQILAIESAKGKRTHYINCELLEAQRSLQTTNENLLAHYLGNHDLVVLDEAQSIENIGLVLKIIADTFPHIQIVATGSSSFDLSNRVSEPLTGRVRTFILYPLSIAEIAENAGFHTAQSSMEKILKYGLYPSIFRSSESEARIELLELAGNYLYKDALTFENLKNSKTLLNLLELLALQLGNEVSYSELSCKLGISHHTVKRYIDLLEKSFIIFHLRAFSRNLRNEIVKSQKIYFYDLGIRNALLQNFAQLQLRQDIGAIWENFCIVERMKKNQASGHYAKLYFWRQYSGQEVDLIEEHDGILNAYEFKFSPKAKVKLPKHFIETYTPKSFHVIHSDNWFDFLL